MFKPLAFAAVSALALSNTPVLADEVEIYLTDMLDNIQSGYCLDIARAQGFKANPDDGLQGHTCYSPGGQLGVDQTFDTAKFADGVLYMTEFDVCAEVSATSAGTKIDLATCNGSDAQKFDFAGQGTISPATAPEMCFTVGDATRTGRSDQNQIKELTLQPCDAENAAYQAWDIRGISD